MVPNHVFSLLSMVAMEPPTGFDAAAIRSKKAEVLAAMPAVKPDQAVRGQYGAGTVLGKAVKAYRQEPNVAPDSNVETYVAMRLEIDNWRWAGVPFYIRTGKHMSQRNTEIAIRFKQAPYAAFQDTPVDTLRPNWLVLRIAPDEGISLQFEVKRPGPAMDLAAVKMDFRYDDWFPKEPNVGYETLLYDVMIGDPTLFMRADMVEQTWRIVQPVLDAWAKDGAGRSADLSGRKRRTERSGRAFGARWPTLAPRQWRRAVMKTFPRIPSAKISALVSDVDGTLVTDDKILTVRAQAAVAKLHACGINFAIISSRPPRGLRMLLGPLGITTPVCGFNGGVIATRDLAVITEHLLSPEVARRAVSLLDTHDVQVWVFSGQDWLVRDSDGPYVGFEERTVGFRPTMVDNFGPSLDAANKIVGVSKEFEILAQRERDVRAALADQATVARSQSYYLDITHPLANKGVALSEIARLLMVPLPEIAVIGDGGNDVAMFERSGLSIAMGNASPAVQQAADFVTDSNRDDGFANAIERFILGGDRSNAQVTIGRAAGRA